MWQLAQPATSSLRILIWAHVAGGLLADVRVLAFPAAWHHVNLHPNLCSYRLKGFTPVSRVSDAAYASAAVSSDDLITLASAANGGDLIVEITGGCLAGD